MDGIEKYEEIRFPKHREMLDILASLIPRHIMQGLAEFDVTRARTFIRRHKEETGERLSFTGWLIKCIAQTVSEYKHVQAFRKGKKLIIFDDVDVGFTMERKTPNGMVVTGYIVRKANKKSFREIHGEIRDAQKEEKVNGALVGDREDARAVGRLQSMPRLLRRLALWKFRRDPFLRKRIQGTVGLTSVGMIGDIRGWPLITGPYPLFFGIGGITVRVGVSNSEIEPREYLTMSLMFDHDAVDGADAARFTVRLGALLKEGFGLTVYN